MTYMFPKKIFLLIPLLISFELFALDPKKAISQFNHDSWTTDNGLPQNTVLSITQTKDGYLWLATYEGLVRYNGVDFKVFDKNNTPQISSKSIISLLADEDSSLYVGTQNGLNIYKDGIKKVYSSQNDLVNNFIRVIYKDKSGVTYVGTDGGLNVISGNDIKSFKVADGLPSNTITSIIEDSDHKIWIGTGSGLCYLKNDKIFPINKSPNHPDYFVRSLLIDKKGNFWIGTSEGILWNQNGKFVSVLNSNLLSSQSISYLYEDKDGSIWIGTDSGLNRWVNGEVSRFSTQDELTNNRIRSIFEDNEGSLWIGTNFGLNRLRNGKFLVINTKKGLSDDFTRTVMEDSKGNIWIGTGEGLNLLQNGKITRFQNEKGLGNDEILSIEEAQNGDIWIGTGSDGIRIYSAGKFKTFNEKNGIQSNVVRALKKDKYGTMWIGTTRGLNFWKNGKLGLISTKDGLSSNYILSLAEDSDGAIWIGTSDGINRIKEGKVVTYVNEEVIGNSNIFSIHPEEDGSIWMGTENGLFRLSNGKFSRISAKNGLFDDISFSILDDEKGFFWLTCNRGIYQVSKKELYDFIDGKIKEVHSISYGKSDGLKSSQCNGSSQPAGWRSKDGKLWFPTARGVAVVDPNEVSIKNLVPPPVNIEQIIVYNESISLDGAIALAPGKKKFEFYYSGLSYLVPEKVRFKYKLEGFDDEWVDVGSRRVAYYTNLPPKEYTFRVIACNNDGVWNETGASVTFELEPYFYQTTWFYIIVAGCLILLTLIIIQIRLRNHKFREKELTELVISRTKEIVDEKDKTEKALVENEKARLDIKTKSDQLEVTLKQLRETQSHLIQSEKMVSLGQLTAGIAHEINNPINFVHSNIEPLKRDFEQLMQIIAEFNTLFSDGNTDLKLQEIKNLQHELELEQLKEEIPLLIKGIEDGARRTAEIVRGLRNFSRLDESQPKKTNLNEGIDSTLKLLKNKLDHRIEIIKEFGELPEVVCHPGQLNQVFMNVISNAIESIEGKGSVAITTSATPDLVSVKVKDTGSGMTEKVKSRIFDPFFTTKPVGKGTGLGLSISYGIINNHKGFIEVFSEPEKGTEIIINIPVIDPLSEPNNQV